MNISQKTLSIFEKRVKSLNPTQAEHFQYFRELSKFVSCLPVGCGKGYLVFTALLDKVINTDEKIFCIATHRLLLNNQHLRDLIYTFESMAGQIGFVCVGSGSVSSKLESYYPSISRVKSFLATNRHLGTTKAEILEKLGSNREAKKDIEEYFRYIDYQNELSGIPFSKTIHRTTKPIGDQGDSIREKVKEHIDAGRKVVLISTYHSLCRLGQSDSYDAIPIDSIFLDEAHMLATEKSQTEFMTGFNSLLFKNNYSLTATPKEADDDNTSLFLLDNQTTFGPTKYESFKNATDYGYIVSPLIHAVRPRDIDDFDNNPANRGNFVLKGFTEHRVLAKSISSNPSNLGAKILVKCAGVGADLWPIYSNIIGKNKSVIIFAGASKREEVNTKKDYNPKHTLQTFDVNNDPVWITRLTSVIPDLTEYAIDFPNGGRRYMTEEEFKGTWLEPVIVELSKLTEAIDEENINTSEEVTDVEELESYVCSYWCNETNQFIEEELGKRNFLERIQSLPQKADAIVLHFDILSEGINVSGFTGVMFIGGRELTETKYIQNIGRTTRLTEADRENLANGLISVADKEFIGNKLRKQSWEKPYSWIIVPYWDGDSGRTRDDIEYIVRRLRQLNIKTRIVKQSGEDEAIGGYEPPTESNMPEIIPDGIEFDDEFLHEVEINVEKKEFEELMAQKEIQRDNQLVAMSDDEYDDMLLCDDVDEYLERLKK